MYSMIAKYSGLFRTIAAFMAFVMYFAPMLAIADEARDEAIAAGREGRSLGEIIGNNTPQPIENADGTFSLGKTKNEFGEEVPVSININDLYPGTNPNNANSSSFQFPGSKKIDIEAFKSADNDSLRTDGAAYKSDLYQDAIKDDPETSMGAAYKILMDGAAQPQVDFRNDPDFDKSRQQIANAEGLTGEFSDCSIAKGVVETKDQVRVHDYKFCERLTDNSEECKIRHEYSTEVIEVAQGENFNIKHCDSGNCFLGWIGNNRDNWCQWPFILTHLWPIKLTHPS